MIKSKIRQVFNFSIDDAGDKGKNLPVYSDFILYFAGQDVWMCMAWIGRGGGLEMFITSLVRLKTTR